MDVSEDFLPCLAVDKILWELSVAFNHGHFRHLYYNHQERERPKNEGGKGINKVFP